MKIFASSFRVSVAAGLMCSLAAIGSAQVTQLWAKRLGASGPQREIGATVATTPAGITYAAGVSYGGFLENPIAPRLWLARYDLAGTRTWLVNRTAPDGGSYSVVSMQADAGGNPVVVLSSTLSDGIPSAGFRSYAEVICFRSTDGAVVWRHVLSDGVDFNNALYPVAMRIDTAGGIIVAGSNYSSFKVRKLNGANGTPIWNGSAVNGTDETAFCAGLALDGANNPILTGYTLPLSCNSFNSSKAMTAKFVAATGATSWVRTYSLANQGDQGKFVAVNGTNVTIGSQSTSSTGQSVPAVVQYDSAGIRTRAVTYSGVNPSIPVNLYGLAVDSSDRPIIAATGVDGSFNFGAMVARWAATGTAAPEVNLVADTNFAFRNFQTEPKNLALDGTSPVISVMDNSTAVPQIKTVKFNGASLAGAPTYTNILAISGFDVEPAAVAMNGSTAVVVGTRITTTTRYPNIVVQRLLSSGAQNWLRDSSGAPATGFQDVATAVARNAAGETYTVGASAGRILCTKHDAAGNQLWQTTFLPNPTGAPDLSAVALDIIVDNQGNPIMCGRAQGINFVTKLAAANGARTWIRQLNGELGDNNRIMTFDSANNVYVVLNNNGAAGLAKIGASVGNVIWATTVTNAMNTTSEGNAVAIDSSSNPFIVGTRRANLTNNCPPTGTNERILVAKFNTTTGATLFQAFSNDIIGEAEGEAIGIDGGQNVVVTGRVAAANPVEARVHTLKFNGSTGALIAQAFFSPAGATYSTPFDIVVNRNGANSWVSVVAHTYNMTTGYNVAVVRYNSSLVQQSVYNLRTTASLFPIAVNRAVGSVALNDTANNVYLAGFEQTSAATGPVMFTMRVDGTGTFGWRQNYASPGGFGYGLDLIYHQPSKQVLTIGPSLGSGTGYDGAVIRYQEP